MNPYTPHDNPDGIINLSIAENILSLPQVSKRLNQAPEIPPTELTYDAMHGSQSTRTALANFLTKNITRLPVSPNDLLLLNGVRAVMDNLAMMLCDEGESILLTGPGYQGLRFQMSVRAGVNAVIAHTDTSETHPPEVTPHVLQTAYESAVADGHTVRAVVICSPDNPTGQVLSPTKIQRLIAWARHTHLHIIFDEIFALSIHQEHATFHSVAEILNGQLSDDVHILWGLSKDFCLAGIRMGVLYTQNVNVQAACQSKLAYFSSTSRHSQWAVSNMLSDQHWVENYLTNNKARLNDAYQTCVDRLNDLAIPFYPAAAGYFVLADFRQFMAAPTVEEEMKLWRSLCDAKVLLTPASEMFASRFGYFRICFAAVDQDVFNVAWDRLEHLLST